MIDVQTMVQEGYKSLAGRTLRVYGSLMPSLLASSETKLLLDQYRVVLEKVRTTGDVTAEKENSKVLRLMMQLLEMAIPERLKPSSYTVALSFATSAVRAYAEIPSLDELLRRIKISEWQVVRTGGGIATMSANGEAGQKRVFFISYNPALRANSVVVNVHELLHGLQAEHDELYSTLVDFGNVKGYKAVIDEVYGNKGMKDEMLRVVMESHMPRFFNSQKVRAFSARKNICMNAINERLQTVVPRMDFLSCYTEGDAYMSQIDALRDAPDLRNTGPCMLAYELLSLTDALSAAFQRPKQGIYMVGVGMVAFFNAYPERVVGLKTSPQFHVQVSEYLSNALERIAHSNGTPK